ncbi:MAG TPA: histidine kinase [Candidatus Acidoferrum sp.]|nr:histidine kinase [Candidatus Acidoferrum sp.]
MHPILSQYRRLALYLLAWIPFAVLFAILLAVPHSLSWREAALISAPLSLIYAFICLSPWYACRARPIGKYPVARIISSHLVGALVASCLWLLAVEFGTYELGHTPFFPAIHERIVPDYPLVFVAGFLIYLFWVAFYYVVIAIEASRDAEARVLQAGLLAREAELKALKAQVNPHFLFNSLNSISALTASDPARAREMCVLLGEFLRRTLGLGEKEAIPLEEELSLIHSFLAVEKVRFGARVQMTETVDKSSLDVLLPPLLLQPLVENAVVHGIANLVAGGWIRLTVSPGDGNLAILVENSFDPEAPPRRKSGVGLANVRRRLLTRYGTRATFEAQAAGDVFCVALSFPAERTGAASVEAAAS